MKVWMTARQRKEDCGSAWAWVSSVCNRPYYASHIIGLHNAEVGWDAYVRKP